MTSALGHIMMRHPQVKPNIEQFLVRHVFPEFTSPLPYMRSIVSFTPMMSTELIQ